MDTGSTTPTARKAPTNSKVNSTKSQKQRKKPGPKSSSKAPQQKKAPKASQVSPMNGLTKKFLAGSHASPTNLSSSPTMFKSPMTPSKRKINNEDFSLPKSSPTIGPGAGTPFSPMLPPPKKIKTAVDDEMLFPVNMGPSAFTAPNFILSMPVGHGSPTTQSYKLPVFRPSTPPQSQSQPQPPLQRHLQPPFNPSTSVQRPTPIQQLPHHESVQQHPQQFTQPNQQQQQQQQPVPKPPRNPQFNLSSIMPLLATALRNDRTLLPTDPSNASTPISSKHIDAIAHAMWQVAFKHEIMLDMACKYASMYAHTKLSALARLNYLPSWWFLREAAVKILEGPDGQAKGWRVDDEAMMMLWRDASAWGGKAVEKAREIRGGGEGGGNGGGVNGNRGNMSAGEEKKVEG